MYPIRTDLQALLAPERARCHVANGRFVRASVGHQGPPIRAGAALLSVFAKNACNAATTCAPSPTAAATRLTEPARTSPIAKTPGRLVSSGPWRLSPVRTKPVSSSELPDRRREAPPGERPNSAPSTDHLTGDWVRRAGDGGRRRRSPRPEPEPVRHWPASAESGRHRWARPAGRPRLESPSLRRTFAP